jgi:hypothetical protein
MKDDVIVHHYYVFSAVAYLDERVHCYLEASPDEYWSAQGAIKRLGTLHRHFRFPPTHPTITSIFQSIILYQQDAFHCLENFISTDGSMLSALIKELRLDHGQTERDNFPAYLENAIKIVTKLKNEFDGLNLDAHQKDTAPTFDAFIDELLKKKRQFDNGEITDIKASRDELEKTTNRLIQDTNAFLEANK